MVKLKNSSGERIVLEPGESREASTLHQLWPDGSLKDPVEITSISETGEDDTGDRCGNCGAELVEYEVQKDGEKVAEEKACPNNWREGEQFEDCPEVVE